MAWWKWLLDGKIEYRASFHSMKAPDFANEETSSLVHASDVAEETYEDRNNDNNDQAQGDEFFLVV